MPNKVTQEYRTVMYSKRLNKDGETVVDVHRFPFNAKQQEGMEKLKKMVARGFTFDDPREKGGNGQPEVLVTNEVHLDKPEQVDARDLDVVQPLTDATICQRCLELGREVLKADCSFHKEE